MPEEEMNEEKMLEEEPLQAQVMTAVEECFSEGGVAYDLEGDAAIDAVITKLEGMKTGDTIGGLGINDEPLDLPEEV